MRTACELAAMLGVRETTLRHYRRSGMPRREDGFYSVSECAAWRTKYLEEGRRKLATGSVEERGLAKPRAVEELDAELKRVKLELEGLKLSERRGEIVDVVEVDRWLAQRVDWIKSDLQASADRLGPQLEGLDGRAITQRLHEEWRRMCESYARGRKPWANDDTEESDE